MSYCYDYPRPMVVVDCVVFGLDGERLKVLTIQRRQAPFAGQSALPGGFVDMDEPLEAAARRELEEETGLRGVFLEQLYTFGDPGRDPRGRAISVAYYALVNLAEHPARAGDDAAMTRWMDVSRARRLAFDHDRILAAALARLRAKLRYQPIGFELLPQKFTLSQLQSLYETVLARPLDKRNFRRKILAMELLTPLGETQRGRHRAARLYRFDRRRYRQLVRAGFNFEL